MKKLNPKESVDLLLLLCLRVNIVRPPTRVNPDSLNYYYFKAKNQKFLPLIKWLLLKNGKSSTYHKTRRYNEYNAEKIVRALVSEFADDGAFSVSFREKFSGGNSIDLRQQNQNVVLNTDIIPWYFWLLSQSKKFNIVSNVVVQRRSEQVK